MTNRTDFIRALRELADFLTVNPGVPVPEFATDIQISTGSGDDDTDCRAVDAFALASGAEPKWNAEGVHYKASLRFGPIRYFIVAITSAHMAEFTEQQRLGREALARQKAAALPVLDGDAVDVTELDPADDDVLLMGHGCVKAVTAP